MTDVQYKLPLDGTADKDLIDWINTIPRSKKAEVIRHALRFYKSHLVEGETLFVMPSVSHGEQLPPVAYQKPAPRLEPVIRNEPVEEIRVKPTVKRKPIVGLGNMIKGE